MCTSAQHYHLTLRLGAWWIQLVQVAPGIPSLRPECWDYRQVIMSAPALNAYFTGTLKFTHVLAWQALSGLNHLPSPPPLLKNIFHLSRIERRLSIRDWLIYIEAFTCLVIQRLGIVLQCSLEKPSTWRRSVHSNRAALFLEVRPV